MMVTTANRQVMEKPQDMDFHKIKLLIDEINSLRYESDQFYFQAKQLLEKRDRIQEQLAEKQEIFRELCRPYI